MFYCLFTLCVSSILLAVSCQEKATVDETPLTTEDPDLCFGHAPPSRGRFKDQRTICYPTGGCNGGLMRYAISYENTEREYIAVAFVTELSRSAKFYREDDKVDGCETLSGLADDRPEWAKNSADTKELETHLKTHCFSKASYVGHNKSLPFTTIYKINIESEDPSKKPTFIEETVAYVLPKKPEYILLEKETDLEDQVCTCRAIAFCPYSFGQAGLTGETDLLSKLDKLG